MYAHTEFVFDIELCKSFIPVNNDGEVDGFELVPVTEVVEKLGGSEISPSSKLTIMDFLVRKGFIDFESGTYLLTK